MIIPAPSRYNSNLGHKGICDKGKIMTQAQIALNPFSF